MIIFGDCYVEIKKIKSGFIDLIIIDPPYLISKKSNFKLFKNNIDKIVIQKFNYSHDFGQWDNSNIDWEFLFNEFYRILKKSGSVIIFNDVWKSSILKKYALQNKFKQPRVGVWIKNNPPPINSKYNYLSNSMEFFFTFVKNGKPTFNSNYDKGVYQYPICHGKERFKHPTQKPLSLIKDLILKHSNENDLVLDLFAGTGTTGVACVETNRRYILIENKEEFYNICRYRIYKNS